MSDRACRICGCFLLVLSLLMLAAGLYPFHSVQQNQFDGAGIDSISIDSIETISGLDLLNRGNADELTALPGIGAFLADQILEERTNHGPFRYPEDIVQVKGIGSKKMEQIRNVLLKGESGE